MLERLDFLRPNFLMPRWRKEGRLLSKGARKFVNYKRDLLKPDRIDEINSRRRDLDRALSGGKREEVDEAGKQLRATCENALPNAPQQSWWEENLEVIFVALVVALGIRTYIVQPFRIPTGSMQPTLNGIIIEQRGTDFEKPWFGERVWDFLWNGTTYKNIVAEERKHATGLRDASWFLFTRTEIQFSNGSTLKLPAARGEVEDLVGERLAGPNGETQFLPKTFEQGEPILSGSITTGDLVLVDKISYHFRKPERGEVFVFDTRALPTHGEAGGRLGGQSGGQHYIKRLCGVPGDALSIDPPMLLNHGRVVQEPLIQRVIRAEGEYGENGRKGYLYADLSSPRSRQTYPNAPLDEPGSVMRLAQQGAPNLREYAALGDNQPSSLDSRYWGEVHEFNISGPGLVSLWPFGSGHWGWIR